MRKYTDVYKGEEPPKRKDVLWAHHAIKDDLTSPVVVQIFSKGKWVDAYDKGDQSEIERLTEQLGDVTTLETTSKDSVVNAINEVVGNIGDLDDITTTENTNLVDVINDDELTIAQALNDLNARMEAVEARPIPKTTHVLEVNSLSEGADTDSVDDMLQRLKLDGHTPTTDELEDLDINITYVSYRDGVKAYKMQIVGLLKYDTEYNLCAGAYMTGAQKAYELVINWDNQGDYAYVLFYDEL